MQIGVCYYPEHWPQAQWADDVRRMTELGISVVRMGEFAWSRLEPADGALKLDWLQQAMDTAGDAGLNIVLGTPTATPPKWLIDKHPDILAVDAQGHTRHFGSRRHYCFSSHTYHYECRRITQILAENFGKHEALIAWQTDNEYGCHDTILSYSDAARQGFRRWCSQRYASIDDLNRQWGNVFWSMEYTSFDEIDLPNNTVTEPNPAHSLSFWHYSTDRVRAFNKLQTDILRALSPGRDLIHNYMGNFTAFDHYEVGKDLDIAAWDNYPLGFLDRDGTDTTDKQRWMRTGHPDSSAFHHDLYRGVGRGRLWVMEQQPGPVNWAPHNPSPLDGMIRLWGLEAMAHSAEVMSYFRWRQMPVAQEQLHTGLCLSNGDFDSAAAEVATLSTDLQSLNLQSDVTQPSAPVAILFDYTGDQIQRILNIGGTAHDPLQQVQSIYSACRQCGINIDIVPTNADLSGYAVILLANVAVAEQDLVSSLASLDATIVLFAGSGCRTTECSIPDNLPPGRFAQLIDLQVTRTESLPDFVRLQVTTPDGNLNARHWREKISSDLVPAGRFDDGWGFHFKQNNVHYINAHLTDDDLVSFIRKRLVESDVKLMNCQDGLRYRSLGRLQFAFNYGPELAELGHSGEFLLGQATLAAGEVAAWINSNA